MEVDVDPPRQATSDKPSSTSSSCKKPHNSNAHARRPRSVFLGVFVPLRNGRRPLDGQRQHRPPHVAAKAATDACGAPAAIRHDPLSGTAQAVATDIQEQPRRSEAAYVEAGGVNIGEAPRRDGTEDAADEGSNVVMDQAGQQTCPSGNQKSTEAASAVQPDTSSTTAAASVQSDPRQENLQDSTTSNAASPRHEPAATPSRITGDSKTSTTARSEITGTRAVPVPVSTPLRKRSSSSSDMVVSSQELSNRRSPVTTSSRSRPSPRQIASSSRLTPDTTHLQTPEPTTDHELAASAAPISQTRRIEPCHEETGIETPFQHTSPEMEQPVSRPPRTSSPEDSSYGAPARTVRTVAPDGFIKRAAALSASRKSKRQIVLSDPDDSEYLPEEADKSSRHREHHKDSCDDHRLRAESPPMHRQYRPRRNDPLSLSASRRSTTTDTAAADAAAKQEGSSSEDDLVYYDRHHRQMQQERHRIDRLFASSSLTPVPASARRSHTRRDGIHPGVLSEVRVSRARSGETCHRPELEALARHPHLGSPIASTSRLTNPKVVPQKRASLPSQGTAHSQGPNNRVSPSKPARSTRSKTSAGISGTILCHQCEVYLDKKVVLHCVSCDRGLCGPCLCARYSSYREYLAIAAYLTEPSTGLGSDSGRKGKEKEVQKLHSVVRETVGDVSRLDFQCPVCKAVCNCANCLRGPYPKAETVRCKLPPGQRTALAAIQAPGGDNGVRSRERSEEASNPVSGDTRYVDDDDDDDDSDLLILEARPAAVVGRIVSPKTTLGRTHQRGRNARRSSAVHHQRREATHRISMRTYTSVPPDARPPKRVRIRNRYSDALERAAALRAFVDEETDYVPVVAARTRTSALTGPRTNAVPRLGSPPRTRSYQEPDSGSGSHGEEEEEEDDIPLVTKTSARVRIGTRVGQRLGKTPANMDERRVEGDQLIPTDPSQPVFTLAAQQEDGDAEPAPGEQQSLHDRADERDYHEIQDFDPQFSNEVTLYGDRDPSDNEIPEFQLSDSATALLPDLDYNSASVDGQTTPSIPSPVTDESSQLVFSTALDSKSIFDVLNEPLVLPPSPDRNFLAAFCKDGSDVLMGSTVIPTLPDLPISSGDKYTTSDGFYSSLEATDYLSSYLNEDLFLDDEV